jgi:hypothetical protein
LSVRSSGGHLATVCASDDIAARIEELQFTLGEGPCIDALRLGAPVLVGDLDSAAHRQWPSFTNGAAEAGVRAVFAFPLAIGAIRVGALDLYRDAAGELTPAQLATALRAADAAAVSLLRSDGWSGTLVDDARERSSYRLVVHQAAGMVMVQLDTSIEDALVKLRAHAYAHDLSINDVAADVVARRLHFTSEDES